MKEFTLKNWMFTEFKNPVVYGKVFNNPKFTDGEYIHTSMVKELSLDDNRQLFLLKTKSGSIYLLPFNAMAIAYSSVNKSQIEELTKSNIDDLWQQIIDSSTSTIENEKKALALRVEDFKNKSEKGSLYLEFIGNDLECAFFHRYDTETEAPEVYEITKQVHVGMFQDSVLITDWKYGLVDYRYFPMGDTGIETYHWSNGLKCIWVNNIGGEHIDFDGTSIPPNSHEIIEKNNPREGLFSPDAVDGKSLLNNKGE